MDNKIEQMYAELGILPGERGCIMADVEPLTVRDVIAAEDLYLPEGEEEDYGIISETEAHVTLLHGLDRSGLEMKKHVDTLLEGWSLEEVEISSVGYFDTSDSTPYYPLIAELVITPKLLDANGRLRKLMHMDTHPTYRPHITLAYIKKDDEKRDQYIKTLNERFALERVKVVGLNYGH